MSQMTGFSTLVHRELLRTFRIINQVVWPPLISTALYLFIFGFALGRRIPEIGGVSYMFFLIPGLILMGVIESSFNESAASLFVARFTENFHELLIAPLSYLEMVLGFVTGGILRALIIGNLTMALGWVLVGVRPVRPFLYILILILVAAFFSALGLLAGVLANNFDQLSIPTTFVIQPLVFLGGVFSPIQLLPPPLKGIVLLNPIFYFLDAFRATLLKGWQTALLPYLLFLGGLSIAAILGVSLLFRSGYRLRN